MILSKLHTLHTKSVDFVHAYPQAKVKSQIYLHNSAGILLSQNDGDAAIKLLKNLYGLKDTGLICVQHLSGGLENIRFQGTSSDSCIFVKGTDMIILCIGDYIIMSGSNEEADKVFSELNKRRYTMKDEGIMEEYLKILIAHGENGSFRMSQPFLIDRIITALPGMTDARSAYTPVATCIILHKDTGSQLRN